MELALIILYAVPLLFVFIYSLVQINLVFLYLKRSKEEGEMVQDESYEPIVTVQLPIYNEIYVVERLIDCVCILDYPREKLEIQLLDDSDDETVDMIEEKVKEWRAKGIDIKRIIRDNREGYKAGALAYGLEITKGEFVAVFDSDFLPDKDFLKQTIPHFRNEELGVVQTKWGHLNKDYSTLTKLQAFGLDAHFSVEQSGRNLGNHFINFNGTAGVWRKKCIENAGGWSSDTLTEDLDLSYRAQLKGWKFKYLEDVVSPAELPVEMKALKSQQFRWTKGAAECVKKNLLKVLFAKNLPFKTKLHATFHLMNSTLFICIVMMSLLSVPLLYVKEYFPEYRPLFYMASGFLISLFILIIFYWVSFRNNDSRPSFLRFLIYFPMFLSVSMGLSLHNAIAVLEGYFGKKTAFLRTPKFNVINKSAKPAANKYVKSSFSYMSLVELALVFYFGFGIYLAFAYQDFGLLPFHLMLLFGYGYVFLVSTFSRVRRVA